MKRLMIILLILLVACTQVNISEVPVQKTVSNTTIEEPGYETPSKVVSKVLEETEVPDFGDII